MENLAVCPVCQHTNFSTIGTINNHSPTTQESFLLNSCHHCGLQFINPRPIEDEMAQYYPRTYYKLVPSNGKMPTMKKFALASWFGYPLENGASRFYPILFRIFQPFFKNKLGRQIPDFIENGFLLEIGCGRGEYLAKMRDLGWNVRGVDVNQEAIDFASSHYQLDVCVTRADNLPYDDAFFDVVFLKHVIEHLHEPITAMKEICRVMKPDGRILITTPNTNSLGNKLFGERWMSYDPPRHLMVHNKKSLSHLFNLTGVEMLTFNTPATNSHSVFRQSFSTVCNGRLEPFNKLLSRIYFFLIWFSTLFGLNIGEELHTVGGKSKTNWF
jgi:2-polyprenyl-3-methyl-5-hydroxy-6-metoxy-1,4-benzoquinol methylase